MAFEMPGVQKSERVPGRICLIDADVVAYWAASGCDDAPPFVVSNKINDKIAQISEECGTDEVRCYLTGKGNFREKVATLQRYKGNRYDKEGNRILQQPVHLGYARDHLADYHEATVSDGEEADDLLGIAQLKCAAAPGWHGIISTVDKDLGIIPGLHHHLHSGWIHDVVDKLGEVHLKGDKAKKCEGTGLKFFYAQLLMGDSTDWIPGLPKVTPWMKENFPIKRLGGCGAVAAHAVVHDAKDEADLVERILGCYASYWDGDHWYQHWKTAEKIYPAPEAMLTEQGQLLWIRQKEGEMWQIPTFD